MKNSVLTHVMVIQQLARKRSVEVYLVGGFLRDMVLGRESRDFDFAVSEGAPDLAAVFAREIRGSFVLLDREHGCARVVKKDSGEIVTFDFADFRSSSLRRDLTGRDFTINTLSLDLQCWNGRDFLKGMRDYKGARKDLRDRRIRMVSARTFVQDPLRLLRAFAQRAVLGFAIERSTLAQIRRDRALIRDVSAERIREELFKILESPRAAMVLGQMDRAGLLEHVIPQIRVMFGVRQGTYHHLDVWRHALETVKQAECLVKEFACRDERMNAYLEEPVAGYRSRRALLKLACLLHDAGKPETRRREGERIRFHGHEHAGRKIGAAVARHLKLAKRERHVLEDMIGMHLRPGYLSNVRRPGRRALFRYFRDTGPEAASIALLAMADQRATRGPMTTEDDAAHHDVICRGLIQEFFQERNRKPLPPLVTGHDLIKILKLKSSPIFSKILNCIAEQRAAGKIQTREQAMDFARKIVEKKGSSFENPGCES